ncbi:NAD-dependent protein deacetylase hst2-1 [Trametes pubescens]|uniref:NAD-dependent protein deacetylase hst2-1 n=1 Tax=Trametes pubescens TaxID=154538 RepID=A0A1M2VKH3_TRAPU|nr:NAD-dependent protein deacetylase hst2-1 [Trametes pubescens]
MDDPDELLMMYDGPTKILESRDVAGIARYMESEQCKRIFVLSTIMARLNLPYPRALFERTYFRFNPIPLYTLARELHPGRYRPTPTHTFVKLLCDGGSLQMCFTENIDALERQAGIPQNRLVEFHGSFASQSCIDCKQEYDGLKMPDALEQGEAARCEACGGFVKPSVAFHGDPPPQAFTDSSPELESADLLFVIGTSLATQPFASLATMVPQSCPRVLINMDFGGDIGMRSDDVLLLGRCDDVVRDLCRELGWDETLEREWTKTELQAPTSDVMKSGEERRATIQGDNAAGPVLNGLNGDVPREDLRLDGANEFGVMGGDGEWQEQEPKSDSLTERLRTALEQSEKPSSHASSDPGTFVARSLSGEELFADTIADYPSRPVEGSAAEGERLAAA